MYGLSELDLYYIRKALGKFPEIDCAILFGSRALGNYKQGSDVDLAIIGANVSYQTLNKLNEWLNEIYPIPYQFDLLHYDLLSNENLKRHIDCFGKQLS